MAREYFEIVGILFCIYLLFRVAGWVQFDTGFPARSQSKPSSMRAHPIDTRELKQRVEEVRRDFAGEAQGHPSAAHKLALVEERRVAISKLEFFQRQPEPEQEAPSSLVLL